MEKVTEPAAKPAVKPAAPAESIYTARELADSCHVFGTSKAVVLTALRVAGKQSATLSDATKLINAFKSKEV